MYESNNKSTRSIIGDITIILTIVLATVVNFTDFKFSFEGFTKITAVSVFIFITTTATYNHCYNKGKLLGKADEDYKKVVTEYDEEVKSIVDLHLLESIPNYLDEYIKDDLKEYRKGILIQFDISYEEYLEKYLRMSTKNIMKQKFSFKMKRAIIKCNHAKPIKITKSELINSDNRVKRKRPLGTSGRRRENRDRTVQLVERLLVTAFAGTVGVDLVFNLSWVTIVQWSIRMLPVLTALVFGKWAGFYNITETECAYKQNQILMIKQLKEWNTRNKGEPNDSPVF